MTATSGDGLSVDRIGLGCAALGNLYETVSDDEAAATVSTAWERGVRFFDTAPLYGHGLSETRLGRALAGRPRHEYRLASKVGRVLDPDPDPVHGTIFADAPPYRPVQDYSAAGVCRSVEESLRRLGTDHLDIAHIHDPDDHLEQAVHEAGPALIRLRDEGVVGAIGVGTNHASVAMHLAERLDLDWVLLAGRYTLLDRSGAETLLPYCDDHDIGVVAGGVFNSGVLASAPGAGHFHYEPASREVDARVAALRERTARWNVPLPAAAIAFPARHPAVDIVLVGPRSVQELEDDLDWAASPIPPDLWDDLD